MDIAKRGVKNVYAIIKKSIIENVKIQLIYLGFMPVVSLCTNLKSVYQSSSFAYPWLYFVRT